MSVQNSDQCYAVIVRDRQGEQKESNSQCFSLFNNSMIYDGDISVLYKDSVGSLWRLSQHATDKRR